MALPESGPLTLNQIAAEFNSSYMSGDAAVLNDFYAGGSHVPSGTTDGMGMNIPSEGALRINDFYGAESLVALPLNYNFLGYSPIFLENVLASFAMNIISGGEGPVTYEWSVHGDATLTGTTDSGRVAFIRTNFVELEGGSFYISVRASRGDPVTHSSLHITEPMAVVDSEALVAPYWFQTSGTIETWVQGVAIIPYPVQAVLLGNPVPTYSATGLPNGISFDATRREFSGTPTTVGTGTIIVTATNSEGSDTLNLTYNIVSHLTAPVWNNDEGPSQSWTINNAITNITVPAVDMGDPTPFYSASGLPTGISFNMSNRVISGTPTVAGSGTITITATNSQGSDTYTYDWTVSSAPDLLPVANAPEISITDIDMIAENTSTNLTASYDATEGQFDGTPTFSWSVSGGGSISGSGQTVTYTAPSVSANTSVTITCTATFSGSGTTTRSGTSDTDTDTETFTVTNTPDLLPVANAPEISITDIDMIAENTSTNLTASYDATEGQFDGTPTFSWSVSGGGSISGSGQTVTYTAPSVSANTSVTITCTATFSGSGTTTRSGTSDTDTASRNITVINILIADIEVDLVAPSAAYIGEACRQVTLNANVTGTYNSLAYSWSGSDDDTITSSSNTVTRDTVGSKSVSVTVTATVNAVGNLIEASTDTVTVSKTISWTDPSNYPPPTLSVEELFDIVRIAWGPPTSTPRDQCNNILEINRVCGQAGYGNCSSINQGIAPYTCTQDETGMIIVTQGIEYVGGASIYARIKIVYEGEFSSEFVCEFVTTTEREGDNE